METELRRLAEQYAAKWRADGHGGDEPTDDAMREAFAPCAVKPRAEWLPAIRDAIRGTEVYA